MFKRLCDSWYSVPIVKDDQEHGGEDGDEGGCDGLRGAYHWSGKERIDDKMEDVTLEKQTQLFNTSFPL